MDTFSILRTKSFTITFTIQNTHSFIFLPLLLSTLQGRKKSAAVRRPTYDALLLANVTTAGTSPKELTRMLLTMRRLHLITATMKRTSMNWTTMTSINTEGFFKWISYVKYFHFICAVEIMWHWMQLCTWHCIVLNPPPTKYNIVNGRLSQLTCNYTDHHDLIDVLLPLLPCSIQLIIERTWVEIALHISQVTERCC